MKFFKKSDILIVAVLLGLAGLLFAGYSLFYKGEAAVAQIYDGQKLVKTMVLSEGQNQIFSVENKENVKFHLYQDGSIAFEQSDCPDKVCINSGKLRQAGQSAACLPNGLILKIVPMDEDAQGEADIIL